MLLQKNVGFKQTLCLEGQTHISILPTEEGNCVQVCKLFFLQALWIREKTVHYTMKERAFTVHLLTLLKLLIM